MKIGATYLGYINVWEVQIEGRGGDSVHEEYFPTEKDAILASAIDGGNHTPREISVMKFSDGTFVKSYSPIAIEEPVVLSQDQKDQIMGKLQPATRLLLSKR